MEKLAADNLSPRQMLDTHVHKTLIECDVAVDLLFVPPEVEMILVCVNERAERTKHGRDRQTVREGAA